MDSDKTSVTSSLAAMDLNGEELPAGLKEELMPKHIAVIVDGNRRWAVERGLSGIHGHRTTSRMIIMPFLRLCSKFRIKVVSLFLFSTENWHRQTEEVAFLMKEIEDTMMRNFEEFSSHFRVTVIGDKAKLPATLQKKIVQMEEESRENLGTHLQFAINYSGKQDIIQACRSLATQVKDGVIQPSQINENLFAQELYTKSADFPCPDLMIRTSGEIRISNFMLWQMAYSKLYFSKKYFPDFRENDLIKALLAFQGTQ